MDAPASYTSTGEGLEYSTWIAAFQTSAYLLEHEGDLGTQVPFTFPLPTSWRNEVVLWQVDVTSAVCEVWSSEGWFVGGPLSNNLGFVLILDLEKKTYSELVII